MNKKQIKLWKTFSIVSIIYSISVVWLGQYLFSVFTNRSFYLVEEFQPRLFQTLITYIPFVLLFIFGLFKIRTKNFKNTFKGLISAYVVGGIASMLMWGYYFYDSYTYIIYDKIGGANIGLGMLMISSPMIIVLLMWISYLIFSKSSE
ncbi:hypothetical protein [Clostridium oceanicum]|uniref:Uncharacterized protein n=1 Tax=Clostridium oceanicum TaxID=1543 RepID=A0ABP3UP89_9CLOT